MPSSEFPVDDPLADLAPVARKIVDAATHLIARAGLKGFTLTAVAAEAGVYADSIRYYFGGIGGLLETIVSSLSHVTSFRALESLGAIDERGRRSQALAEAGLESTVSVLVASTEQVAPWWTSPLTLLFLDGNHTETVAQHDYSAFARHLLPGGLLAVHDVFPDPRDGGAPPWHVVQRALDEGFTQLGVHGSLRLLQRTTVGVLDPL